MDILRQRSFFARGIIQRLREITDGSIYTFRDVGKDNTLTQVNDFNITEMRGSAERIDFNTPTTFVIALRINFIDSLNFVSTITETEQPNFYNFLKLLQEKFFNEKLSFENWDIKTLETVNNALEYSFDLTINYQMTLA